MSDQTFLKKRIAAEARGMYRQEFLNAASNANSTLQVCLHFGDKNSHFDITGLVRKRHLPGKRGYLLGNAHPQVKLDSHKKDDFFDIHFDTFKDQLKRNSCDFVRRGHSLKSQQDYYGFYRLLCQIFEEKLLEAKISHVIFFEIPHLAIDYALYLVSKKLAIPTLILTQKIPGKIFSMWDISDFGNLQMDENIMMDGQGSQVDVNLFYMDASWQERSPRGQLNLSKLFRLLRNIIYAQPKLLVSPFDLFAVMKRTNKVIRTLPDWRDITKFAYSEAQMQYFEKLSEFEGNEPDLNSKFIYVPLHLQPEMTTSSLGGKFVDQALLIESLSKILPHDWRIYVKENPKQSCYDRGYSFFQRIRALSNVTWVPADTDTNVLSARAKIVATVSGVAGWEAIKLGTPAIIFGVTWYASMPGVFKYHDHIDIEEVAEFEINKEDLEKSISYLFSKTHDGNIDKVYFKQVENFDRNMNAERVGRLISEILLGTQKTTFSRIE